MKLTRIVWVLLTLVAMSCSRSNSPSPSGAMNHAAWQSHCNIDGIAFDSSGDRRVFQHFAQRCLPVDACTLSCMRSGCAKGVSGGCFHMCNPAWAAADLASEAAAYKIGNGAACARLSFKTLAP